MDAYLAAGWRCMGQSIYISHFMFFPARGGSRLYSTLPTRLALEGREFSKSQRRLWRRNEAVFQIEAGAPAVFDDEKKEVNSRYAAQFPGRAISPASGMLDNGAGGLAFDTREVKLYHEGRLAAFSFFDFGKTSIYSKQGVYDPAFRAYSPGFFTMLVEIAFGRRHGVQYYYPGYVVPGYPEFDYKHRAGPLEYFDLFSGGWKPFSGLREADVPVNRIRQQLGLLQGALNAEGIKSAVLDYRFFDIRFYDSRPYPYLEHPVFLLAAPSAAEDICPLAVFEPARQAYSLYNCRFFGFGASHPGICRQLLEEPSQLCTHTVALFGRLGEGLSPEAAVQAIKPHCR